MASLRHRVMTHNCATRKQEKKVQKAFGNSWTRRNLAFINNVFDENNQFMQWQSFHLQVIRSQILSCLTFSSRREGLVALTHVMCFFISFHECFLASTVVAIQQQSFSLFSFLSGSVFLQMTYFTDEACCSSSDAASAKMLISLVCFSKSSVMSVTTNQSHTSSVSKYNNNTKDK